MLKALAIADAGLQSRDANFTGYTLKTIPSQPQTHFESSPILRGLVSVDMKGKHSTSCTSASRARDYRAEIGHDRLGTHAAVLAHESKQTSPERSQQTREHAAANNGGKGCFRDIEFCVS